jgi:hypothetical protein
MHQYNVLISFQEENWPEALIEFKKPNKPILSLMQGYQRDAF